MFKMAVVCHIALSKNSKFSSRMKFSQNRPKVPEILRFSDFQHGLHPAFAILDFQKLKIFVTSQIESGNVGLVYQFSS